jgi:hypothetical protein
MMLEDGKRIHSNNYADLFVNYSGNFSRLEQFTDAAIQIIDCLIAESQTTLAFLSPTLIQRS